MREGGGAAILLSVHFALTNSLIAAVHCATITIAVMVL